MDSGVVCKFTEGQAMKRRITYRGIKEIVYTLNELSLNAIIFDSIRKNSLFVKSHKPSRYEYEWNYDDKGAISVTVTQKIIESEESGVE